MTDREALRQCRDQLDNDLQWLPISLRTNALKVIAAADAVLAQPEQEPVACNNTYSCRCPKHYTDPAPAVTLPPLPEPFFTFDPIGEGTTPCTCNAYPHMSDCGNLYASGSIHEWHDQIIETLRAAGVEVKT